MSAPAQRLVTVMNAIGRDLAVVINQGVEKNKFGGAPPAEAEAAPAEAGAAEAQYKSKAIPSWSKTANEWVHPKSLEAEASGEIALSVVRGAPRVLSGTRETHWKPQGRERNQHHE